ncbi:hypothetical protein MMC07_005869 [Pseudocyphellaria aurata]|nr:hypothetical protein [Pseudocyphellaria aurata]
MRQTRKGLMRGEKKANTQGAQAHAAQENTHGGVFDSRAESSAMGEHRGDFGSAFRPDFNGSFSHTGPGGELVSGSGETIGDTCANQETPSSGITPHPHTFPPQPTLSTTPDSTTEDPSGVAEPQYDHELRAMADWSDELLRDTAFSDLFSHTGQLVSDSDETIGDTRANQENPSSDTIPPPTPHHAVPPDSTTEDPSGVAEPQYADELRQMAEWSDGLLRDLGSFSHTGQLVSGSDETIGGTHANQETSSSDTIRPLPTPHHAVPPDSTAEYPSGVAEPQYDHELRAMAEWTDEELRDTAFSDLFSHTGPSEELVSGQTFPPQPTLSDTPLPTRPENQMIPSPTPHHAVPPDSAAEDFSGVAESPHAQKLRKFVDWVDGILRDIDNL